MTVKVKGRASSKDAGKDADKEKPSRTSTEQAKKVTSTREPQPEVQDRGGPARDEMMNEQGYDPQNHMQRSAVTKEDPRDPLQGEVGLLRRKNDLAIEEGTLKEPPIPRGLPLSGEAKQRDEQRRDLRDPRLPRWQDEEQKQYRGGVRKKAGSEDAPQQDEMTKVELCPPRKTYVSVNDPVVYKVEDGPFLVSIEKARTLFSLRDDRNQPIFRNARPKQQTIRRRNTEDRMGSDSDYEDVPDEVPVPWRHIAARQRPDAQADEDETVMTQRGLVSKGRRDVDYEGRENETRTGDRTITNRATRERPASVPAGGERIMGDMSNDNVAKSGGIKV